MTTVGKSRPSRASFSLRRKRLRPGLQAMSEQISCSLRTTPSASLNRKLPTHMTRNEKLAELRALDANASAVRHELGINRPGTITFLAQSGELDDTVVLVECDGFGTATTRVVEGNYPVDYVTKFERVFPTE